MNITRLLFSNSNFYIPKLDEMSGSNNVVVLIFEVGSNIWDIYN